MATGRTTATRSRSPRTDPHTAALAAFEAAALRGRLRHWGCIPPSLLARLRPRTARIADALATCLGGSEALRMNRVVALGSRGLASASAVDAIVDFYRGLKCRAYSVEVAPGPQQRELARWLAERGFLAEGTLAMLRRDLRLPVARASGAWRVHRATRAQIGEVVDLFGRVFPVPASMRPWSLAGAAVQGEHYFAYPRAQGPPDPPAAAVATLVVDGRVGWLRGGATLTGWRRRGGQGALIAVRLRRAARLGCRWAWSETQHEGPGRSGASRRNLLRMGFEDAGVKTIFVRRDT